MTKQLLAEFVDGGPGCSRDDCMVTESGGNTTLAYYPPIINAQGVNVNPDKNKTHYDKRCLSCGKSWTETWQNGTRLS
jgi:hypothetical protein